MIKAEQLLGKYVIINNSAFNEQFKVSDECLGCQDNWPGIEEQMVKFVKQVDKSDNTIAVSDSPDPSSSTDWVSVVRIVRILEDNSTFSNSDEDFLLLNLI